MFQNALLLNVFVKLVYIIRFMLSPALEIFSCMMYDAFIHNTMLYKNIVKVMNWTLYIFLKTSHFNVRVKLLTENQNSEIR